MRYLITFFLCLIHVQCFGWGSNAPSLFISNIPSEPVVCGDSTLTFSDSFNVDLSGFTQDSGTWLIGSGSAYQSTVSGTSRLLRSNTTIPASCQWGATQEIVYFDDSDAIGLVLRASGATGLRYVVKLKYSGAAPAAIVSWDVYNGTAYVETVQSDALSIPADDTDDVSIMAQVSGTGDASVMKIWVYWTGSGPSTAGEPTYTFTDNPLNPVDSGDYIGLFSLSPSGLPSRFSYLTGGN